jgi:hypothetical protein
MTISAWVYPTNLSSTTEQKIISMTETGGYALGILGTTGVPATENKVYFTFYSGGAYRFAAADRASVLSNNTWAHIVGVYDGNNIYLYVNGVLVDSAAQTGAITYSAMAPLCIGSEPSATTCPTTTNFAGKVDEVKVYGRALSSSEVSADYQATNSGIPAGLALGTITPGTSNQVDFDNFVKTDASAYTLSINQDHDLQSGANTISPVSGNVASPVSWSEGSTKGLGFSLYGTNATAIPGKWTSGSSFAALPNVATTFYSRNGTPNTTDLLSMRLRLDTVASQPALNYSNQMTITGTITP